MKITYVPKSTSRLMRAIDLLLSLTPAYDRGDFLTSFWTTLRLPWWPDVRIYHPDGVIAPETHPIAEHELVHARDFAPWWGPWRLTALAVLPIWGWWVIEREAHLADVRAGRRTPESAAESMATYYRGPWPWPTWPRRWMAAWIRARV